MERQRAPDPLRKKFLEKVIAFSEKYPYQGKVLQGQLMLYASYVPGIDEKRTVWDIIKSQIDYQVGKHNGAGSSISAKDFIDYLFEPNPAGEIDAEIIMARLQIG